MVDTNVVLDVLLNRPAFVQDSATILRAASDNIQEFITRNPSDYKDSSFTDINPTGIRE
jgi:hypothetical protein